MQHHITETCRYLANRRRTSDSVADPWSRVVGGSNQTALAEKQVTYIEWTQLGCSHKAPENQGSYVDHLHEPKRSTKSLAEADGRRNITSAFPKKLHVMLDQVDKRGLSHIVSWQPHGRCFLVHNKREFIEIVVPR